MTEKSEAIERLDDKAFRLQRLIDRIEESPRISAGHLRAVEAQLDDLICRLEYLLDGRT